ncbi:hypothetical protein FRB94_012328 [Tulasnella sp. JGI-2019a]|nr:hypothetical protein FRB94_012328 [Tulasnella sp. JGI-2019a]
MPPKRVRHRPAKKSAVETRQPFNLVIIKDTTNKGKGVFASSSIPQGMCIISEYPIIAFPLVHDSNDIITTVEKCTEDERNKILAFSYSPSKASLNPYQRVALTNCVPMAEKKQAGLFETICRVNHDCRPNAMYSWNESLGKEVLYAMVEAPAGGRSLLIIPKLSTGSGAEPSFNPLGISLVPASPVLSLLTS